MVYAEKHDINSGGYLKPKNVKDGVSKIRIDDEFIYVDTEYEGKDTGKKLQGHVSDSKTGEKFTWTMNPTTANWMIDTYGKKTEDWIGKELEIAVKQAGSASPGIYPKECSLEKVIA